MDNSITVAQEQHKLPKSLPPLPCFGGLFLSKEKVPMPFVAQDLIHSAFRSTLAKHPFGVDTAVYRWAASARLNSDWERFALQQHHPYLRALIPKTGG